MTCNMTSEGFTIICESFSKLEKLELGNCEKLTDEDGMKFRSLRHLRSLKFERGLGFTDRTFEEGGRGLIFRHRGSLNPG